MEVTRGGGCLRGQDAVFARLCDFGMADFWSPCQLERLPII